MRDVDLALSVPRTAFQKKGRGIPKLLLLKFHFIPEPVEAPPEEPDPSAEEGRIDLFTVDRRTKCPQLIDYTKVFEISIV